MPVVPHIRKQILAVIDEQIVPILKSAVVTQVVAEPPFSFGEAKHWELHAAPLPDKPQTESPLDMLTYWEEHFVLAKKIPHLGFLYSGANDERWGITEQMAEELAREGRNVPSGITAVRLMAPCATYVPAGVPRTDGKYTQRAPELQSFGEVGKLSIDFTPNELFIYHFAVKTGATHHLHIYDQNIPASLEKYVALLKLRQTAPAQLLLLEIMSALRELLLTQPLQVSNSSWPSLQEISFSFSNSITESNFRICSEAITYIQLHLSAALSRDEIAMAAGVSAVHLNRVFKKETGLTVMDFVTQYRLAAARTMLQDSKERVGEIAHLVGFSGSHSLDTVFKRAYGMSPLAYRRMTKSVT
jgi:AraC-like DNA-binding protein